jgi:phage minor structural protein
MEVVSVKPILFEADNTNYDHNGIGVLFDAISCTVTEEYNGAFDIELEYPVDGEWANDITKGRQILAKPNDVDEPHAFRIYEIDSDLESEIIMIKATSITDDLSGNLIPYAVVTDVTAQQALTTIKQNLIEPTIFDFVSDIQTRSSSEWTRINPLQAIAGTDGSFVDLWGGDIKRTNNTVYLYSRRGTDHVTVIRPGKNINGFNMVVSTKGMITKILPFYEYTPTTIPAYHMVDDGTGTMVKQQEYEQGEQSTQQEQVTVIGDVVVSDNAAKYAVNYYSPIDFSQNDYIKSSIDEFIQDKKDEAEVSPIVIDNSGFPDELHAHVLSLLNEESAGYFIYNNPGCDEPSIQIKADMIELADSPEWEKYKNLETIQVTDTVDVYVEKFDVDVEVSIQDIVYDSIGERVLAITAGSARNNLVQSITKPYEDKTKELEKYIETLENGVYNTINRTANGQSRRFSGYTEPPADISSEGDMWFKEIGNGEVESYIYNGAGWMPVINESVIDGMTKAITDAQDTANDAASKAKATADDISAVVTDNGYTTLADLIASRVSTDEYGTLFAQNATSIGLFYEVDGVTQAMILLDNGTPYIKGNNIVLDGDTIVNGTFTVTDTMLADDAVINKLKVSGIDAKDVTIINLDASSITGGDLTVTDTFRIMHNGVPVLEVDANTGQVKITAPNLATQTDLENIELTPGPQGIQGPAGTNGLTSYTHIAYADSATGTGWSQTPTNKTYVGMYTDFTQTDSTDPTKYKWSLIKGADGTQGIPGPKGADGLTPYFHVAYATNATGTTGFDTVVSTGKTYLGQYTDNTSTDSTDPTKYAWTLIQGPAGPQGLQGVQGTQGNTGIQGPIGANGTSSYTHIAYATNATGTTGFDTGNGAGATYIGMYVDSVATDSADPTKYQWTLIKGADGTQGIQGPAGTNGQTPYLHIAYATNATGTTGFDTTVSTAKTYIGTYTDFVSADSTDPTKYAWSLIKGDIGATGPQGPQGTQGPTGLQGIQGATGNQGIQGVKGADGVSSYTHIAYSTNATGTTGFDTSNGAGATYIGMYVDSITTDSTDPTKYQWSLIKGADGSQGIQGPTGANGQTSYLHIAYATNATGTVGFDTVNATAKTYIGTYTDFVSADSTDPTKYSWSLIQGPTGATGPTGNTGPQGLQGLQGPTGSQGLQGPIGPNGIPSYTHIAYSTSATGATGFSTSNSAGATYIGMYADSTAADSTDPTLYAWSLIKGADGSQGIQGPTGANGQTSYLHIAYATSSNGSVGFDTTVSTGKTYIGQYTDFTAADSASYTAYSWSLIQGPTGPQGTTGATGPQGIQGPTGTAGTSQYVHIRYSANADGSAFTTTPQANTAYIGLANTTSATAPTLNTGYTWSLYKGPQGNTGIQGPTGTAGVTTYTWVKYADDVYGGNMTDTPSGKRYVGFAFNKTTATETTNAGDYQWSPLYDNVQVGGRNIILSSDTAVSTTTYLVKAYTLSEDFITGQQYTMRLEGTKLASQNFGAWMNGGSSGVGTFTNVSGDIWTLTFIAVTPTAGNERIITIYQPSSTTAGQCDITWVKLEKGNVGTDWSPAPEDVQAQINYKAETSDMDALANIVSSVSADLNNKAGMTEFQALQSAYDTRVAQDIIDKNQVASDLATLSGRTALVETLAGNNKLVTDFINTVITESDEGIYISNGASSTGILIASDRISFMDNDIEVAYISNQTMQINHGIFVESATIANFKFEIIPGTKILAIQWVGV